MADGTAGRVEIGWIKHLSMRSWPEAMGSLAAKLAELKLRLEAVAKGHYGYGKRSGSGSW